jgi:hypothetical protein
MGWMKGIGIDHEEVIVGVMEELGVEDRGT